MLSRPTVHYSVASYNACRHRICLTSAERPREEWIQTELERLPPCEHYHAVFTLPHDFIALWAFNRERMNTLLFDYTLYTFLLPLLGPTSRPQIQAIWCANDKAAALRAALVASAALSEGQCTLPIDRLMCVDCCPQRSTRRRAVA